MSGLDLGALRGAMEGICASSLCTCDPDGIPNASMISQVHWVDEHHVALSYQFFNKTRANLLATRQASVAMTDARTMARWRLQLDFVETQTEGPLFEIMKAKLAGIASLHGLEGVFRLLGADIFRVVSVEALAPAVLAPPRRGVSLLAASRACIAELSATTDFDELADAALDGLVTHFGIAHAMLLMAEGDGRLFTIASRGYAAPGTGAEVLPGEGVIGVAAREGVPIRIGHFSADYRYGAAIGAAALSAGLLAEPPRSVPFPGLGTPHSQIAVPIRIRPIVTDAIPSKTAIPVVCASQMPMNATTRPSIAALSSNNTTNMVGFLARWIASRKPQRPLTRLNSRNAKYQAAPSNTMARPSTM